MYKHLLIPTDGSELSENAILKGIALAKSVDAKVTGQRQGRQGRGRLREVECGRGAGAADRCDVESQPRDGGPGAEGKDQAPYAQGPGAR